MSALERARARLSIHDPEGHKHTIEGEIAALAAAPGAALVPREEKPWDCLLLVKDGDVARAYTCPVGDLEILLPGTAEDREARSLAEVNARAQALDDEAARLTVELNNARTEIARQAEEIIALQNALQSERETTRTGKRGSKAGA